MPKLLLLSICEKIITNQETNSVSLIDIFPNVQVHVSPSEEPPKDLAIPFKWYIFCFWQKEESDANKKFVLEFELLSPSGKPTSVKVAAPFVMERRYHRHTIAVEGMPVAESGEYSLQVSMSEEGLAESKRRIGDWPISVVHTQIDKDKI